MGLAMLALVAVVLHAPSRAVERIEGSKEAKPKLVAKERHRFEFPSREKPTYTPLRFSPDGLFLASSGEVGTILIWDVATGKEKLRLDCGKDYSVGTLLFSPDGAILIANLRSKKDSLMKAWDITTGRESFVASTSARVVGFEQKTKQVVCLEPLFLGDARIQYRSLKDGSVQRQIELSELPARLEAVLTEDGRLCAKQGLDLDRMTWKIAIRELATDKEIKLRDVLPGSMRFSMSGRLLVCNDLQEEAIRIWKTDTGEMIQKITPPIVLSPLAISADDKWIACGIFNKGRHIIVYEVASGKELGQFVPLPGTLKARQAFGLAFSPKGNLLASSNAGAVQVWELTAK